MGAPNGGGMGGDEALLVPHLPPSHPTSAVPPCPPGPLAAPQQLLGRDGGVGGGGGCGTGAPSVCQSPHGPRGWPCCVPAPPWLCPPALWPVGSPQGTGQGDICTGCPGQGQTKGSLVPPLGATMNWAAPSLCCCRARGHLGDTSVPVGRGEQWGNRGRGGTGESGSPEGPEQAQPSLPALFIAGTAMCRTCAAARAGAGVSPGCARSGLCPCALTTSGALGDPVPVPPHTVGLSRHRDPVTRPWG